MEMRMYFDSDFANDPVKSTLDFGVCLSGGTRQDGFLLLHTPLGRRHGTDSARSQTLQVCNSWNPKARLP